MLSLPQWSSQVRLSFDPHYPQSIAWNLLSRVRRKKKQCLVALLFLLSLFHCQTILSRIINSLSNFKKILICEQDLHLFTPTIWTFCIKKTRIPLNCTILLCQVICFLIMTFLAINEGFMAISQPLIICGFGQGEILMPWLSRKKENCKDFRK